MGIFVLRKLGGVGIEYSALNNCILLTKRLTVPLIKWEKCCMPCEFCKGKVIHFIQSLASYLQGLDVFLFFIFFWYYNSAQIKLTTNSQEKVDREEVTLFMMYLPSFSAFCDQL